VKNGSTSCHTDNLSSFNSIPQPRQQEQQQEQQQDDKIVRSGNDKNASSSSTVLYNPLLSGCRSVYDTYERICHISEGTYGIVWKARYIPTKEIVALKQIKFDVEDEQSTTLSAIRGGGDPNVAFQKRYKEGFPVTALREINVLLALSHENIVHVKEMVVGKRIDQVYMVMEYFEYDIKIGLSKYPGALAQSELKSIMSQILQGIHHIHSCYYIHRDLKPSNLLVHATGRIAIGDFGLARHYSIHPKCAMTQLVVTLWYRAPELLFGETYYGPAIDMWSVGCILGELIRKESIFHGAGELDQIDQIFTLLGIPDDTNWPSFTKLPNANLFRWKKQSSSSDQPSNSLSKLFPIASTISANQAFLDVNGYQLLQQLLTLDPDQRLTAKEAIDHAYFKHGVQPKLPKFFSSSSSS
jgi:cell division cycle 2-like